MGIKNIFSYLAKQASKAEETQKEVRKFSAPQDSLTPGARGEIIVKSVSEDAVDALNKTLVARGYKGKGLDFTKLTNKILGRDGTTVNVTDLMQKIKIQNKELFDFLKRPRQPIEDMVKKVMTETADKTGFTDVAYKIMSRKVGTILPVEDMMSGLILTLQLGQELEQKARKIRDIPRTNMALKKSEFKEFQSLLAIQINLMGQVSGSVSEVGRSLGAVSSVQKLRNINLKQYRDELNDFMENLDEDLIDYSTEAYLSLSPAGRAEFAREHKALKTYDAVMELYINAILSSPVTHVVNIAGNAGFQILQTAETGLASVIGNVRTLGGRLGDANDRVLSGSFTDKNFAKIEVNGQTKFRPIPSGEASAEAFGMMYALKDAFKGFGSSLVTGEAGDFMTKIDLKNPRAIGSTNNIAQVLDSIGNMKGYKDAYAPLVDILGILGRLPGRFLGAEDEFFKVISERAVMYREAYRDAMITYQNARRSGEITKDQARQLAEDKFTKGILEPSESTKDLMSQEALVRTFQGNPEGIWSSFVGLSNIPGFKIIVPFSKTPTNIIKEAFDRTLNWSPIYRTIMNADPNLRALDPFGTTPMRGKEFDKAVSKLMIGNGTFAMMALLASGYFGDDIVVMGSGPKDKKARKFLEGAGISQYSINFKQADGTYKGYTFSRFDPMSAVLAMAADYAYYAHNSDADLFELENLFKAGSLASAEYAQNMPYLQGVSELMMAAGNPYASQEDTFQRFGKYFGEQLTSVGTNAIGQFGGIGLDTMVNTPLSYFSDFQLVGQTSFRATLERLQNPNASNTMLNEDQLATLEYVPFPSFVEGFYVGLNRAKSRSPSFSDDLLPGLNFWGETKQQSNGVNYEVVSPIKVTNPDFNDVNEFLRDLSDTVGIFKDHPRTLERVKLSDAQYNDFVTFINESNYIDKRRHLGSDDRGYKVTKNLLNLIQKEIADPDFLLQRETDQFNDLNSILSNARKSGTELLLKKYPELQIKIDNLKN